MTEQGKLIIYVRDVVIYTISFYSKFIISCKFSNSIRILTIFFADFECHMSTIKSYVNVSQILDYFPVRSVRRY